MVLAYDFYLSAKAISNSPSQEIKDRMQALIDGRFDISTSLYEAQEESTIGSNIWEDVAVRLTHKINVDTGVRLSDDWRNIIFQDRTHNIELGMKYIIAGDVWLTINT
jgi:hypothetical protein